MAERAYVIQYNASSARQAASDILSLCTALERLDGLADRVKPKLAGLVTGASRPVSGLATALERMNGELGKTQAAAGTAGAAIQTVGTQTKEATPHIDRGKASMGGFVAQAMALSAAHQIFTAIMEESKALEAYWKELAAKATAFQASLKELASMQGDKNVGQTAGGVIDVALAARLGGVNEARDFMVGYQNFGQTVRELHHYMPRPGATEEEQKALETAVVTETGRTAHRLGIDPKEMAMALGAAGILSSFSSTEEAMQQVGGAIGGIQMGTTNYREGLKFLNEAASKLVGPEGAKEAEAEGAKPAKIRSFAEAGIYMGALSLGTGGKAGVAKHQMIQISRALRPNEAKPGGADAAKALKAAGLTDEMDDIESLIQLDAYLTAQGINGPLARTKWMEKNSIGTEATRGSLVSGFGQAKVLKSRIEEYRRGQKDLTAGKSLIAENKEFMAKDPTSAAAGVATVKDAMDKIEALSGPEELEKAKEAASERLRLRNPSYYNSLSRKILTSAYSPANLISRTMGISPLGLEQEQDQETGAFPTLIRAGKAAGLDLEKMYPGLRSMDYKTRADAFKQAANAVRAKGGDPWGTQALISGAQSRNQERIATDRKSSDPAVINELSKQTRHLESIDHKTVPGRRVLFQARALPVDGDDSGPRRAQ